MVVKLAHLRSRNIGKVLSVIRARRNVSKGLLIILRLTNGVEPEGLSPWRNIVVNSGKGLIDLILIVRHCKKVLERGLFACDS